MQTIKILTAKQWAAAEKIVLENPDHQQAAKIRDEIVKPGIKEIEKVAGQEMDPGYVSCLCLALIQEAVRQRTTVSSQRRVLDHKSAAALN